jgi:hypothetical protein
MWEYCSADWMYRWNVRCKVGRGDVSGEREERDDSVEIARFAVSCNADQHRVQARSYR